jgi:hypothetical protein
VILDGIIEHGLTTKGAFVDSGGIAAIKHNHFGARLASADDKAFASMRATIASAAAEAGSR